MVLVVLFLNFSRPAPVLTGNSTIFDGFFLSFLDLWWSSKAIRVASADLHNIFMICLWFSPSLRWFSWLLDDPLSKFFQPWGVFFHLPSFFFTSGWGRFIHTNLHSTVADPHWLLWICCWSTLESLWKSWIGAFPLVKFYLLVCVTGLFLTFSSTGRVSYFSLIL